MSEQDKANKDLIQYGQSFTVSGKHIPLDEVILSKSEQDRIAFDALNRLIEQDHKVPQGSMTLGIISERLNHRYKTGFIDGYKESTAEANKRIDAIESEVANLHLNIKAQEQLGYELQASNNTLRELSEKIYEDLKNGKASRDTMEMLREAISATPAESLQAHDDEVLERAAKVCDEKCLQLEKKAGEYLEDGEWDEVNNQRAIAWIVSVVATSIRALKQEVK